ncbi:MAG TPA: hypothetical protein VNS22_07785 [Geminicoccus sp.]|uniref:hypothetical protein n=1 Tax=Geminicoccus sp. TaxID=2024832 RepID=UPI002BCEA3FD|nr:hypothetical protein [Geminicoccus sp.]HWL68273.1 hypothetical protein [Geminicoccus sp.]
MRRDVHLEVLERRIEATTARLEDQRARLAWRQRQGFGTAEARALLGHLEDTLALLVRRRTAIILPGWLGMRPITSEGGELS